MSYNLIRSNVSEEYEAPLSMRENIPCELTARRASWWVAVEPDSVSHHKWSIEGSRRQNVRDYHSRSNESSSVATLLAPEGDWVVTVVSSAHGSENVSPLDWSRLLGWLVRNDLRPALFGPGGFRN